MTTQAQRPEGNFGNGALMPAQSSVPAEKLEWVFVGVALLAVAAGTVILQASGGSQHFAQWLSSPLTLQSAVCTIIVPTIGGGMIAGVIIKNYGDKSGKIIMSDSDRVG